MDFSFKFDKSQLLDALVLPFFQGGGGLEFCGVEHTLSPSLDPVLQSGDFSGKEGECLVQVCDPQEGCRRFVLLGLGKLESLTQETMRKAFANALKALKKKKKCEEVGIVFPKVGTLDPTQVADAIADGLLFASYNFTKLKSALKKDEVPSEVKRIHFIGFSESLSEGIKKTALIHQGLTLARDLVNANADEVTPQKLAQEAIALSSQFPALKVKVLDKAEIEKNQMGLLLAVNRGSHLDPAVIILEYQGDPSSKEYSAVVGKGITFDTGGLNLKPTGSIETMKCDMAGAATVLGLMKALVSLKLGVNVIGAIASTENAIGPKSYKPGDVYRSYSGKTVEISNTDAEGRLVLADVISYVQDQYKLLRIIDLATLTGAVLIALGEEASGLFSNSDTLAAQLMQSGEKTFERLWRLPLFSEFKEALKSSIADCKNAGGRKAGSCTAALFIQEFIKEGMAWAHLDIAGTAYLTEARGYHNTPATGVGIRLLVDFFQHLKA